MDMKMKDDEATGSMHSDGKVATCVKPKPNKFTQVAGHTFSKE
jgi:hypothetical protein